MLLTKAELDLAKLASKEESRYTLQAIAVDKEETVVTNGYYLVRVTHQANVMSDAWPMGDTPLEMAHVNGEPRLLSREAALAAGKAIPRKATIPVLRHAALAQDNTLHTTDLESPQQFPSDVPGRFPNWKAVMPRKDGRKETPVVIGLDASHLALLAKYFADHGNERKTVIKLTVWNADDSILMESTTPNGQDVQAVLMPCGLQA